MEERHWGASRCPVHRFAPPDDSEGTHSEPPGGDGYTEMCNNPSKNWFMHIQILKRKKISLFFLSLQKRKHFSSKWENERRKFFFKVRFCCSHGAGWVRAGVLHECTLLLRSQWMKHSDEFHNELAQKTNANSLKKEKKANSKRYVP